MNPQQTSRKESEMAQISIAVIAMAAWKGGGQGSGKLVGCPEPLLPLGDGETIVSRLVKQLQQLDFEIVIAAGKIGYPYRAYAPYAPSLAPSACLTHAMNVTGISLDSSPWTQERIDYLSELGKVIQIPNPGVGNCHDTYCQVIDSLTDDKSWGRLLLIHGDTMFTDGFLQDIMDLPWPSQFIMHPLHSVFKLDRSTTAIYRKYAESYRTGWETWLQRKGMTAKWPDGGSGGTILAKLGIPGYGMDHVGRPNIEIDWLDIDDPSKYSIAKRRIEKGEM
jgi:hypothetical protein